MKLAESISVDAQPVQPRAYGRGLRVWLIVGVASLLAALLWAYWPIARQLWRDWQSDQNYSVGQLVPLAALWLIWRGRAKLRQCTPRPCWWALAVLLAAQVLRWEGMWQVRESLERYSLVMTIWGLVLLAAGKEVFWRLRWIMAFLLLMLPLPGSVHNYISAPLQAGATTGAVMLLEIFGVAVTRQGNTILLNDSIGIAVAEACSGLRMLTAFIIVSAVLAGLVVRPRWQKVLLLLSSVPVAIACNLIRLFVTAELYLRSSDKLAERFFHDGAGIVMMPMAVGLLMGELWLFNKLVVSEQRAACAPLRLIRISQAGLTWRMNHG